ncbi:Ig-like domain-containing protein [Chitinophaga lutea]
MHQFFTKHLPLLFFIATACLAGNPAMAQYTTTILETGRSYKAVAVDKNNHLYVVRSNGASYEVARYSYGAGTPTVIYTGLSGAPGAYAWGIAVNNDGVVFVTNPNPANNWEIIKLTPGSGGTYTPQVVQTGNRYSALTISPQNRLMALEYPIGIGYRSKIFAPGQEDQVGTHLMLPINVVPNPATWPWGLAVDAADNLYALDLHENNGGQVIRINSAGGYTTHDIVASGRYYSALAIDRHNNFYTTERFGPNYEVIRRTDLTQPTGQILLQGLSTNGSEVPWGLAVNGKGEVFVGDGSSASGGRLVKLSPPGVPVMSSTPVGPNPTNQGSVQFTVSFGGPAGNVTPSAFNLHTTGNISGASVTGISAVNTSTYMVTVNTGTGDGQLRLDVTGHGIDTVVNNAPYASGLSFTIDKTFPSIMNVGVPANGHHKAGVALNFTVQYNENVTVNTSGGTPSMALTIGSTTVQALYTGGSGTNKHTFSYTVQPGENDTDGITLGGAIALNGGTMQDAAGNALLPTLQNVAPTNNVFVNTSAPSVVLSTSAPSVVNGLFQVTATFSEAVTGLVTSDFSVTNATLSNLTTSNNITYTLDVSPTTGDPISISLPAAKAVDVGGNSNLASNVLNFAVDNTPPAIISVSVPPYGTYLAMQELVFTLLCSEAVTVTGGTPTLPVTIGSEMVQAAYLDGSGSNTLRFRYVVENGDLDTDGVVLASRINLAGAAIRDAVGNDLNPLLQGVASTADVRVDAVNPVVTAVNPPANGYYKFNDVLDFKVRFTESVHVSGSLYIPITIGSESRRLTYAGGTGTNTLSFGYTVQNGDLDMDGVTIGNEIFLNGGSVKDTPGNAAVLVLNNIGNSSNVFVNTVRPTVTLSMEPVLNGSSPLTITFSEAVTDFTATDISVSNATITAPLTSDNITYTVTVTPVTDGAVTISIPADKVLNIGRNGNEASNTISYNYDRSAPVVTATSVPADGYYNTARHLDFTVRFSENVTVTGTPQIPVIIGTTTVNAAYTGGSGSNALSFRYTVQNGDQDMDGIAVGNAILLNSGTIRDASGNNALPALNNTGSTGRVYVNTHRPTVTVTISNSGRVNQPVTAIVAFSEAVTGLTAASFQVTNGAVSGLQSGNNITYSAIVTPAADGLVSISLPADVAQNIAGNGNNASNTATFTYDATAPVVATGQSFSIDRNSPNGTVLGQVRANAGTDPLQNWAIATDGSGGALEITANGTLQVKDATRLASLGGTTIALQITVSDGLNTSAPTPVTVAITFVNKAPTLAAISNVSHCPGTATHTLQLTGASATEPDQTFTITATATPSIFDLLTVDASNVLSYRLKPGTSTGSTTVTVHIKDNGGTQNGGTDTLLRTFTVTVTNPLSVTITSNKGASVSKGETVTLTATGGDTYAWTDAPGIIGNRQNAALDIRPQENMTYEVSATNAAGCTGTATFNITVISDFKVDATNVLTPNGDGRNDRWIIRNLDSYPDNEVKIFDRAGRIVYQRRNYSNDWDGTTNGSPLAEGTYYYILTINNGQATTKGYITIVRDSQ